MYLDFEEMLESQAIETVEEKSKEQEHWKENLFNHEARS